MDKATKVRFRELFAELGKTEAETTVAIAAVEKEEAAKAAKAAAEKRALVEARFKEILTEAASAAREFIVDTCREEGIDDSLFPGSEARVRYVAATTAVVASPAILDEHGGTVRPAIEAREATEASWLDTAVLAGPTTKSARKVSETGVSRAKLALGLYEHKFKDGTKASWNNDGTESATAAAGRELKARGEPTSVNGLLWWKPVV